MIRSVLQFPDPELKKISRPVQQVDDKAVELLTDLADTLYKTPGVGLAAPQLGVLLRAIVVDVTWLPPRPGKAPPKGHGLIALINPRILKQEGTMVFREGCLSIPDFLADIQRSAHIQVEGLNRHGEQQTFDAEGFEAVALQHEIDHLDGILFLDRVANLKTDLISRRKK